MLDITGHKIVLQVNITGQKWQEELGNMYRLVTSVKR